jgi:hypothetical protein
VILPLDPFHDLSFRSTDTAVGQSIGFATGVFFAETSDSHQLEEVLRTRWIGCRVDYLGNSPPIID